MDHVSFIPPKTNWDSELIAGVPFIDPDFTKDAKLFLLEIKSAEVGLEKCEKPEIRRVLLFQIPAESASFCSDILIPNNMSISHVFLSLAKNLSTGFFAPGTFLEEWVLGVVKTLKTQIYTSNRMTDVENSFKAEWLLKHYQTVYKKCPLLAPNGTAKTFKKLRNYKLHGGQKNTMASVFLLGY